MTVQPPPSGHPWLPPAPPPEPALPVVLREYPEFWQAPRFRWWRSLLTLILGLMAWFIVAGVIGVTGVAIEISMGNGRFEDYTSMANFKLTPIFFLANNLGLAAAIPIAYVTQWAFIGQRPRWLSSVTGGFRWGWFGRCAAVILPVYLVVFVAEFFGRDTPLAVNQNTLFMLAAVLLTTPLQSAGEEFLLRGIVFRSVAAWFPRVVGLVVGIATNAAIFMALHLAGDPWLNAFYLLFATTASVLAWKTGGLEAPIALHVVNNLTGLVLIPFQDFSGLFNREAGAADAGILFQFAVMLAAAALIWWQALRLKVVTQSAPAAASVVTQPWPPLASEQPESWGQQS